MERLFAAFTAVFQRESMADIPSLVVGRDPPLRRRVAARGRTGPRDHGARPRGQRRSRRHRSQQSKRGRIRTPASRVRRSASRRPPMPMRGCSAGGSESPTCIACCAFPIRKPHGIPEDCAKRCGPCDGPTCAASGHGCTAANCAARPPRRTKCGTCSTACCARSSWTSATGCGAPSNATGGRVMTDFAVDTRPHGGRSWRRRPAAPPRADRARSKHAARCCSGTSSTGSRTRPPRSTTWTWPPTGCGRSMGPTRASAILAGADQVATEWDSPVLDGGASAGASALGRGVVAVLARRPPCPHCRRGSCGPRPRKRTAGLEHLLDDEEAIERALADVDLTTRRSKPHPVLGPESALWRPRSTDSPRTTASHSARTRRGSRRRTGRSRRAGTDRRPRGRERQCARGLGTRSPRPG